MSTPKSNSEREHSERERSEDNAAAASPSKSSVPKGWFIIAPSSIAIGICFWGEGFGHPGMCAPNPPLFIMVYSRHSFSLPPPARLS